MNLKIQDLLLNSKDFRLRCLEDEKYKEQFKEDKFLDKNTPHMLKLL